MRSSLVISLALLGACADDGGSSMERVTSPDAGAPDAGEIAVPDAPPPTKTCDATVQLGSGVREYQAVKNGDTVYLYRGPQGGLMIYLSVRAKGLDPSDETLCYTETFTETGEQFGSGCWKIMLTNDLGDGVYERVGVWGQVDSKYWTTPSKIRGKDAKVRITLSDSAGCSVAAGWDVHISLDPGM